MAVDQWQACVEQVLTHWTVLPVLKPTRWLVPMRDWKLRMALMHGTPRGHVHSHGWCVAVALGLTQHILFRTYAGIEESCVLQMFVPALCKTDCCALCRLALTVRHRSHTELPVTHSTSQEVTYAGTISKTTINSNHPLKINVQPISNRYCAALIQLWRAFFY